MQPLAENLWLLRYPLTMLGADLNRNVTVMRLAAGECAGQLVLHSTGPFSAEDTAAIHALGRPGWILETMLRHDTFAPQGHTAFPDANYLAPDGFSQRSTISFPTQLLGDRAEWAGEIGLLPLEGVPSMNEWAVLHRPSGTLIVTDLLFNFGADTPFWTHALLCGAVGFRHNPGMSRPMRFSVKDRAAFRASLAQVLEWDFDRLIVGHGEPILTGARARVEEAFRRAGWAD